MFDLVNEILQTLRHNKLRTGLTGFAVAWGIFILIVLLGVGNGVTNAFRENMLSPGSQRIEIWGGRTSKPFHGYKEGRSIELKNPDIATIRQENKSFVNDVISTIYGTTQEISSGRYSIKTDYNGVFPSEMGLHNESKLTKGRFINDKDMSTKSKVMVLPEEYAKRLFPDEDAIGKRVAMNGLSFQIVGVYTTGWGNAIYIPYTTAQMLMGKADDLGSISVQLKGLSTEEEGDNAETQLRQTLSQIHDFAPDDKRAVWIWNQFSMGMRGMQVNNILSLSIWILGLLTLLSGIVGISNIMFVSVRERTHEIGIRRAIGAKPRSILIQIMAESVAITTLFGYIGIVLGTIATTIIDKIFGNEDMFQNPTVDLGIAIQVTIILIIAGALAGLFPALKSLKVKPVEALRDE